MSLKIISILLLLTCLNITLADQDCYVKLYPEENFHGSYVRAIFDSTLIKDWEFKSLKIIGNCIWDLYIIRLHGAGGDGSAMINKKMISKFVPGQGFKRLNNPLKPPYYFQKKPRPFRPRTIVSQNST